MVTETSLERDPDTVAAFVADTEGQEDEETEYEMETETDSEEETEGERLSVPLTLCVGETLTVLVPVEQTLLLTECVPDLLTLPQLELE